MQVLSIANNLTLASLDRFTRIFHIKANARKQGINDMIRDLSIKAINRNSRSPRCPAATNRKVVIGKALMTNRRVLLMDEPTARHRRRRQGGRVPHHAQTGRQGPAILFQPPTLKRSQRPPTASPFSATASWSPSSTEAKQRKRLSSRHLPKVTDTKESSRHDGGHLFHIPGAKRSNGSILLTLMKLEPSSPFSPMIIFFAIFTRRISPPRPT